tara:strand:+ start:164 stop:553 length:390 start_codon:yes stop_codon:yes gene_type:complete
MKLKYIFIFSCIFLSPITDLEAGCGSCRPKKKAVKQVTTASVIAKIPKNRIVEGLVEASCGMCNFGMNSKRCGLAIRIGEQVLKVSGSKFGDHGDVHAKDGMCETIRVAEVSGRVYQNYFYSDRFALKK